MRIRETLRNHWIALGALSAVALISWQPAQLTDAWMYAATGRWIVDNRAVPWSDPLTWTFAGSPWQSNGWLWGVLLYAVLWAGGFAGMAAIKPLMVVAIGLSIRWAAQRYGATSRAATIGMMAGILLILGDVAERPQLASFALLPLSLAAGTASVRGGGLRWRPTLATAVIFAVWTNLHSAALGGLVILGAATVGVVLDERPREIRRLARRGLDVAVVMVAAGLATLANPYGTSTWSYARYVREVSKVNASEWANPWQVLELSGGFELILIAFVVVLVFAFKAYRRLDVLLPTIVAIALTLEAVRNAPTLVLTAAVVLPAVVPKSLTDRIAARRDLLRVGVVAMLAITAAIAIPRIVSTSEPGADTPVGPSSALPAGCRLANDYTLGNWVLWARPDIPTSIDGRNDVYGLDLSKFLWFYSRGDQQSVIAELRAADVTCVLSRPSSEIVTALEAAGWRVIATDDTAVALVPPDPPER